MGRNGNEAISIAQTILTLKRKQGSMTEVPRSLMLRSLLPLRGEDELQKQRQL